MIQPTIQSAMSELLRALGFDQMAKDVLAAEDSDRELLRRYAHVIVKNAPKDKRASIVDQFKAVRLYS